MVGWNPVSRTYWRRKRIRNPYPLVPTCCYSYRDTSCCSMQIVVLRTKTAKAAILDILTTHCIPSAMSDDLKK
ncbi:hypothetical protein Patl1_17992 [Pistacia atlantica]|uniref:Uncharacterized protein n=1 Tax=Pistacia atlantica TaxID=434234 RepID=A0ACC1C0S8_9ROSI|nr:hypothetical protein Patl1_17992 [Pistacia atlantica]